MAIAVLTDQQLKKRQIALTLPRSSYVVSIHLLYFRKQPTCSNKDDRGNKDAEEEFNLICIFVMVHNKLRIQIANLITRTRQDRPKVPGYMSGRARSSQ